MDRAEHWGQVDELFAAALERELSTRIAFLESVCAGRPDLRREVEKMLAIDEKVSGFIERSAFPAAADLLAASSDPDALEGSRFMPGDRIANRYRVAGLLGRGGMGEVYRADDLKLRQRVALKFLPERLSSDGAALARFYQEVSLARQISHRHVCRVYDVAESNGQHFLSMEYVQGEDLASLLRRIVRPQQTKALEIARQLGAGLAAIHEKGVLHRDLKPGNVMLDDAGQVRITDFGLATLTQKAREDGLFAGTPAYMSPEQLTGQALTVRSDIYSLGLVLYEVFTGKRAFEANRLQELIEARKGGATPIQPSRHLGDLDPVAERVILQCLEREPEKRPGSALEVLRALPGGDPIAAALALGETPSPEMVAASPKPGTIRPVVAAALLGLFLLLLALTAILSGGAALHRFLPLGKSREVLEERAHEIVNRLGYTIAPRDTMDEFVLDSEYLGYLDKHDASPERWRRLATAQPGALMFLYRQSPGLLEPNNGSRVTFQDPPNMASGMISMKLDMAGGLSYFEAVPAQIDAGIPHAPDWGAVLREAGLDPGQLQSTPSQWTPPTAYDVRAAWSGVYPRMPEFPIRVEAAAYRGQSVYFEIVPPWRAAERQVVEAASDRAVLIPLMAVFLTALSLGTLLAVRNLRLGKGDRRGAMRLAIVMFAARMIHWTVDTHHVASIDELSGALITGLESALFWSVFLAVMYLALEPLLRRHFPERLIGWSRLLAGEFRDPLVGRDLLVGCVAGSAVLVINYLGYLVLGWLRLAPAIPDLGNRLVNSGFEGFFTSLMDSIMAAVGFTFIGTFLLLFLTLLLRRRWAGGVAGWMVFSCLIAADNLYKGPYFVPVSILMAIVLVLLIARFGVLATIATMLVIHLRVFFAVTTELNAWYARGFVLYTVLLVALAIWGAHIARAGRPLLRPRFLD